MSMITVDNVYKYFKLYQKPGDRLREIFFKKNLHRNFTALNNISFSLERGSTLGIIGENGSGKSTLLKLIAGVLLPDSGDIICDGKITGLLELGTGFNGDLSGEQNIFLNGTYLYLTKEQLEDRKKDIIAFSELGDFIYEPLKNYSSGMIMRLAFSIAIHADPQAFIIDEALSVGDVYFQQKCFDRLREFKKNDGSILFVSHDMNAVKLLCDNAIVLHHGRIHFMGDPDNAVNIYNQLMAGKTDTRDRADIELGGYGNAAIIIKSAHLLNSQDNTITAITSGESGKIVFSYICYNSVEELSFGIMIRDRFGQDVFGSNGFMLDSLITAQAGKEYRGYFFIEAMNVSPGAYTVTLAAHTGDNHLGTCFHWLDNAISFEVLHDNHYLFSGHTRLKASLHFEP